MITLDTSAVFALANRKVPTTNVCDVPSRRMADRILFQRERWPR
jgi:hypothetical protein